MLDMPIMGEVQMEPTPTNTDCVGHNDLCKAVSPPNGEHTKTGDCKELDYIDTNNFNRNEVSETHSRKFDHEPFCVTGKDLDLIDIDDLF